MTLFHDLKDEGESYTVKELSDHLLRAVEAGEGARTVMVGPTGGDDLNEPTAISIMGIECNKETGGGENDIYWLYPAGGNEWQ